MPAPVQDLISAPTTTGINISLEPAYNALQSLLLLSKDKGYNLSGLAEWISQTRDTLSEEEREHHNFVMMGFYFAFLAHNTKTIWWTMIAHALGGLIMVI